MEYLSGGTLTEYIRAHGALSPSEALTILSKIAGAVQYIHDQNIIHRDLKSSNVMLTSSGEPVLIDFGSSLDALSHGERLTPNGLAIGTPHYMAPEQITSPMNIDHRADIYALGIMLYEMLTGELPLAGSPQHAMVMKSISEGIGSPREIVPDLPVTVEHVCLTATHKDREERYPDANALIMACRYARAVQSAPPHLDPVLIP